MIEKKKSAIKKVKVATSEETQPEPVQEVPVTQQAVEVTPTPKHRSNRHLSQNHSQWPVSKLR